MLASKRRLLNLRFNHTWISPKGHDTGIKVYNCVTKTNTPLIFRNKNLVTWYTCGPTVYDSSHIGHASCYIKLDNIQRILTNYFGYNLVTVMNITDIDDKIIKRSNLLAINYKEVSTKYEKEFWQDLEALNVRKPNLVLKVSNNIPAIIKFIEEIVAKESAYKAKDGSVYFRVKSTQNYGKLQNIGKPDEETKSSVKEDVNDFALWKASKEGEPSWESPWGAGRPGWHIECSAMASKVFGSCIDIHAGGIDLRFPHHENEEAQSCVYHSKGQWVNYWLHAGHLHLKNDAKMSKSLKNTISIQDLLKTTPAEVFRLSCLMSHYRKSMEYSTEYVKTATNVWKNYKNFNDSCTNFTQGLLKCDLNSDLLNNLIQKSNESLHQALCDDFNTPEVINILNEIVSTINAMLTTTPSTEINESLTTTQVISLQNFMNNTLNIFGLNLSRKEQLQSSSESSEILDLLNVFRQNVRQLGITNKDSYLLKQCDEVRDELQKLGVNIKDLGKVSTWSR